MDKKVIFDFDKTLLSINTFTYWVFFILVISFKKNNFKLFLRVGYLIFLRKILNSISHKDFKKNLLLLNFPIQYNILFSKRIHRYVNLDVLNELLNLYQENYKIVISSAAPENYLKIFIEDYFKNKNILVIGAKIIDGKLIENFKEEKLENLIQCNFIDRKEKYDFLFTDSKDDISLAENAKKIYLIHPNKKSKRIYLDLYSSKVIIKEKAES